ncbi:MAG: hypothetical protein KY412_02490 [Actinobacteria bacterium]|nr:hypothetical protein [Actinomycetota bacterium]
MNPRSGAAGWVAVGSGVGAAGLAAVLLHRTLVVVREISRYADHIAGAGDGIRRNTDVERGLIRMRALAGEMAARAGAPGEGVA